MGNVAVHTPETYVILGLTFALILTCVVAFVVKLNRSVAGRDPRELDDIDETGSSENEWFHSIR